MQRDYEHKMSVEVQQIKPRRLNYITMKGGGDLLSDDIVFIE